MIEGHDERNRGYDTQLTMNVAVLSDDGLLLLDFDDAHGTCMH